LFFSAGFPRGPVATYPFHIIRVLSDENAQNFLQAIIPMGYSLPCYIIFSIDIFPETIDNFYMRILVLCLALSASLFALSCDTTSDDKECNKSAVTELMYISFKCSDATFVADNGYADYDDCVDKNLYVIEWTILSCKGRGNPFP
jgi:hypothetical protein